MNQKGLPAMLECQAQGVKVHVAGVYGAGVLVGHNTHNYVTADEEALALGQRWAELAAAHGVSLPAVALAFCAMPACVEKLVIGCATVEELEQNLAALEESASVPAGLWAEAKEGGLLPADIPTL